MIYIFKDQSAVRLILETSVDFTATAPSSQKIKYEKPDETTGEWTASQLAGSLADGKIYVDFTDSINFDAVGKWKFWAELTFSDGRVGIGSVYHYLVYDEGDSQIT